jgi:hypothetical protein
MQHSQNELESALQRCQSKESRRDASGTFWLPLALAHSEGQTDKQAGRIQQPYTQSLIHNALPT